MKNAAMLISVLTLALVTGSCRQDKKSVTPPLAIPATEPATDVLTLSSSQLLFLDWDGPYASHAKVINKRPVGDSATEFDIRFPGNKPGNTTIDVISSGAGGRGRLIGYDVGAYKSFALKFTLVSINGEAGSDTTLTLTVGALIGPTIEGKVYTYTPVTLGGAAGQTTAISETPMGRRSLYHIGIHAHMVEPENWDPAGSTVTIRVEPVKNGTIPVLP